MGSYNTSEFRKGLKVQVDGEPYLMIECNFVKPGKGQALYRTKLRNLLKNTVVDRTYKSGDSIDSADVRDSELEFLYQDGNNYVFMDPETFEQPSLTAEQVGDDAKWLKDGLKCQITFWNDKPIAFAPPKHLVYRVEYTEPGAKGNTATIVTKSARLESGAEVQVPIFIETGNLIKVDTRTAEYIERVREDKRSNPGTVESMAVPPTPGSPAAFPAASIDTLKLRGNLLQRLRSSLIRLGYWEVETPLLSRDICVEAHIEPFHSVFRPDAQTPREPAAPLFLQTSPEFAMKRLLCAGSGSIFQITRSFRNGECGRHHNPEFTIVEWYRVAGDYRAQMTEVGELVAELAGVELPDRVSFRDAFREFAGCDPFSSHGPRTQKAGREAWTRR